jgi:hypothetical protein
VTPYILSTSEGNLPYLLFFYALESRGIVVFTVSLPETIRICFAWSLMGFSTSPPELFPSKMISISKRYAEERVSLSKLWMGLSKRLESEPITENFSIFLQELASKVD